MTCDLEVDTGLVRRASSQLVKAAELQALPQHAAPADVLSSVVCHGSAPVREALRLAVRRAEQGVEAASRLATFTTLTARKLTITATEFDRVELVCSTGF